jgi:hypothetical protein
MIAFAAKLYSSRKSSSNGRLEYSFGARINRLPVMGRFTK